MKKWFSVLLAAVLLSVAVGAWAEVVPTKLGKGGSQKEPLELKAGILYHGTDMSGYYSFTPSETGEHIIYSKWIDGYGLSFQMYNEYGEKLWDRDFYASEKGGTQRVNLVAGKEYLIDETSVGWIISTSWFSICSPSKHISFGPSEIRQNATCDSDGYMAQICEYCGGEGARVAIPATGHKTSMVTVQKATCTDNGLDSETCQTCGAVLSNVVTPATGHQASDWKRKASATCTEDGREYTACTVCGVELESRAIPTVGHKGGGMTTVQEATCIQTGLEQDVCLYCKEVLSTVVTPVTDHQPDAWQTGRETTCTGDGYRYQLCIGCGKTLDSETIPAFGHSISEWKTIDASCTENGKRYKECTVCSHELEHEAIPATGHQYGEWIETAAPTTKAEGTETRTCLFCGAQEKRAVAKLTLIEGILGRKK